MSKNKGSSKQSGENKPAPTGNPGTRSEIGVVETEPAPTGNLGTFSKEPPKQEKP